MKILLAIVAGMLAGGLLTMAHGPSGVVIGAALGLVLALIARRLREQADRLADQDAKLHYLYQQFSAIQAEQASRKQAQAAGTDAAAAPSQPAPEPGLAGAPEAAAPARASAAQTAAGYAPAGAALDSTIAAQVEPAAPAPPPLRRPAEPAAGLPEADFPPPAPDWVDRAQAWLFGGNTVARLGVVVLFFGLAFLLKYAYEHSAVPPEMRLLGASVLALGLLGMGWKLRLARPGYALSLQGAAVGALYLTIFAALRLYGLLPPGAAFALLVLIAALSALLAVLQNAMAFAMLGAAGGFLAPLLTSTGSGSHVQLFSYYLLLDLGILFIAWKRAWRPLNLLGFAATFGVASLWGARYYRPELYATMEIFLVAFFLIYFAIPLLFARLPRSGGANYVDGTLVFGTPIAAFALQTLLVRDFEYGLAWTAVGLGALYLAAATFLLQRTQAALRLLAEALFALGVCFATLVFPLAFDARVSSAAWALEGCGLVWLGLRQRRPLPRAAGLILQLLSGGAYLFSLGPGQFDHPPGQAVLNPQFMGAMLIALAGLLTSLLIERGRAALAKYETGAASALFGWGWLWWLGAGLHECVRFAGAQDFGAALIFVSASWLALSFVQRRLDWQAPQAVTLWLIVVMWFAGVLQFGFVSPAHPAAALGWLAWPLA
ncbi:MAG: DUF2339 domain-containing protein, partial [Rhodocyclaceae bacterium]|nr:DUF2339 domain-containing protein [Rhodocyclaceae bacterium]